MSVTDVIDELICEIEFIIPSSNRKGVFQIWSLKVPVEDAG